jgi:hypothetical protein
VRRTVLLKSAFLGSVLLPVVPVAVAALIAVLLVALIAVLVLALVAVLVLALVAVLVAALVAVLVAALVAVLVAVLVVALVAFEVAGLAHFDPGDPRPRPVRALKLGMSSKKAVATGLIALWTGTEASGCSLCSHLKGAGDAKVCFSGAGPTSVTTAPNRRRISPTGVERSSTPVRGSARPRGVHIGSTKARLLKACPDWTNAQVQDPNADGVGALAGDVLVFRPVFLDRRVEVTGTPSLTAPIPKAEPR